MMSRARKSLRAVRGVLCLVAALLIMSLSLCACGTAENKQAGLPVLSINLHDGLTLPQVNRTDYEKAALSVEGSAGYDMENIPVEIRGRGNASWSSDKKSYKLKFFEKQDMFGIMEGAASRHWVLVGNYRDCSLSRNPLAYTLAGEVFDNIAFTPGWKNVELYVNGEYRGVYTLCESIRAEEGRVDIDCSYEALDTGYLLEYDMLALGEDGIDYFSVNGLRYPVRIDSPSPSGYSDEAMYRQQVAFIYSYMQQVFDTLSSGDFEQLCSLVDIDSVIDVYLINELFKNSDVGMSSFYMYKQAGGKLFFGPIWDFDKSCQDCIYGGDYRGIFAGAEFDREMLIAKASNQFFCMLMENEEFKELVRQRWDEIYPRLTDTVRVFVTDTLEHAEAFDRNFEIWSEYCAGPAEQSIRELGDWLCLRADWLNEYNWGVLPDRGT